MQPNRNQRKSTRAIVDPTAWEASEVGEAAEGTAMIKGVGRVRNNKVSSIRSSLFQKNAKGIAALQALKANTVNDGSPVFKSREEAAPLQAPFTFDGNISVAYCDYGRINKKIWPKDILALVHNPVRSELTDMISLLTSAQRMNVQLKVRDFVNIRSWWQVCSGVVLDFLDLEVRLMLPWFQHALDNAKIKDTPSAEFVEIMPSRQKDFRDLIMTISKSFGDLCDPATITQTKTSQRGPMNKKALLVVNSLDALVSQLCDYMWEQEMRLPVVLTAVYKEKKERDLIINKVIKYMAKNARKSDILLVLMTRWMSDSKLQKSFTKTIVEISGCNYSSLQSQFELNHAGFIHQFRVKSEI